MTMQVSNLSEFYATPYLFVVSYVQQHSPSAVTVPVYDRSDANILNEALEGLLVQSRDMQTFYHVDRSDEAYTLTEASVAEVLEVAERVCRENDYILAEVGGYDGVYCAANEVYETDRGLCHRDDCTCCEHCNADYYAPDDWQSIVTEDGSCFCSSDCAIDSGYYLHSCGGWYDHPEYGDDDLRPYDATNPHESPRSKEHPYWFGMEVEKEDSEWRHCASEVAEEMDMIAVEDGSLDSYTGFELVTKRYNLTADMGEYNEHFDHPIMRAASSTDCGGHITVSKKDCSGMELLSDLGADFVPLLFALYPKRLRNCYAPPTKKKNESPNGAKYRAVRIDHNRVEFRIFPQVRVGKQAKWRVELLRLFATTPIGDSVYDLLGDPTSELYKHLEKVYTPTQIGEKHALFVAFKEWYTDSPISGEGADIEYYTQNERDDSDL